MSDFVKVKNKSEYDAVLNESDVRTDIKVGGKDENTGGRFVPNINMQKWGGECWLNINHPDMVSDQKPNIDSRKIHIEINNKIHRYKILDRGRIEYEIDFLHKPVSPVIRLNLDFPDDLQFWPQPELTQLEKDQGMSRPEDVIDSYAVYWKKRHNKYKTGKFCHIYRIRVIDSYGIWTWCTQQIAGKEWIITIPADFWRNAVYPITLDPVLGYSTPGASCLPAPNRINGFVDHAPGESGKIVKWHCAVCMVDETDKRLKLGIYKTDGNESPSEQPLVDQVEFSEITLSDDNSIDPTNGGDIFADDAYFLGFGAPNSNNRLKLDTGGHYYWYNANVPYNTAFSDPAPVLFQSQQYTVTIWVEYEPAAPPAEFMEVIEGDSIITKQIDGDSTITKKIDEKSTITKLIDEESPLNG